MQANQLFPLKKHLSSIYVILLLGFTLRIFYAMAFPETELRSPSDSFFYNLSAEGIVNGEGYHEKHLFAYRPPLYAFFLSFIYRLFGGFPESYQIVVAIQSLLGLISIFYLYKLSFELFKNETKAKVAALLFCLFPTFITLNAELLTETLFFGIFIPGFYYLYRSLSSMRVSEGAAAGILFGLSALTREITFYFIPFTVILFLLIIKKPIKQKLIISIFIIVGFSTTLAPWLIRNNKLFETPLISTSGGINFYMGNNDDATGFFKWKLPEGATWANTLDTSKVSLTKVHKIELTTNRICYQAGLDFIKKNPSKFFYLTIKRLIFFWLPPFTDLKEIQFSPGSLLRFIRFLSTVSISFLGLYGIINVILKKQFLFFLPTLWVFYTTFFHSIVVVNHRYSLTMIPFLCILSVIPIFNILKKNRLFI
jgi:4-amino-4-deoxy-L-arabinose transferase-like glycosyltransferase